MRIVYCIPSLHIHGGMERVVSIKANYFADVMGYEVYIVMTDAKEKKPFFKLSDRVKLVQLEENFEELWCKPLWKKIFLYFKHTYNYKRKLRKLLCELKPDITISTLRREINFLCDIKDGSKKIGELHMNRKEFRNLNQDKGNPIIKKIVQTYWNKQLLKSLKKLDSFVVLTDRDKDNWRELNNVIAIPNPLAFYAAEPSACNKKNVIAVGRFCYQKGFDLLLDAWREVINLHPDWTLNIYGDNGDKITKYMQSKGLEQNCKLNPVTEDIQNKFSDSSIFVLSSRFEGFGMVICEAMAYGVPPVAFDCSYGPKEIIKDNIDGLLVKNGDVKELSTKICALIEDENKRKKLGHNAYTDIKRYHIESIGQKWVELFNKLTKK